MKLSRVPFRLGPGGRFQTPLLKAELRLRLLDTIDWCLPRADAARPKECLRTPELQPHLFNESRHQSVYDVAWARHRELARIGITENFPFSHPEVEHESSRSWPLRLADGRLLVWYRDVTCDDGICEAETSGFLDFSDMPPWDTWVAYVSPEDDPEAEAGYLVSWVPPQFVAAVQSAIECNAYDALLWLSDTKLLVAAVLRGEGLLA